MYEFRAIVAVSLCASLLGCGADQQSANEQAGDAWVVLFDGTSLDAWKGYRRADVPSAWRIAEGTLHFAPDGQRGDLVTTAQFDNFELTLEWRISPGGNSGIMFRVSEDQERPYETGPEMQVLDNEGHVDGGSPLTSAGANYALHAPTVDATNPVGSWNQVRLVVDGAHVEHWLNDQRVVEYELWSDEWKALVAESKFAEMPGYGLNHGGHIVLQDHGDPVWYRNIRIRALESP